MMSNARIVILYMCFCTNMSNYSGIKPSYCRNFDKKSFNVEIVVIFNRPNIDFCVDVYFQYDHPG